MVTLRRLAVPSLLAVLATTCTQPQGTTAPAANAVDPSLKTEPEPEPESAEEVHTTDTGILSEQQFAALHQLTDAEAPPPRGTPIDLAGGKAYLSLPEGAAAPLPAVLVIHEWWGLNDHIRHWTDRLAASGYAALAVDLYGGQVATDRERALELMKGVDEANAQRILDAAYRFLDEDARVKATTQAVVGWCFGGGWSLRHALRQPELDAAIVYYGHLPHDPAELDSLAAPVLGVFGNQDAAIPPTAVDAFADAMSKAGKSLELHRYDAQHAFANPSSGRYNPEAAEDAWTHAQAFLKQHLNGK